MVFLAQLSVSKIIKETVRLQVLIQVSTTTTKEPFSYYTCVPVLILHSILIVSQLASFRGPLNQGSISISEMGDTEMHDKKRIKVENLEIFQEQSKKLEDDLQQLALKVKHHEDNMKFLKSQINSADMSIVDMQVDLGKSHLSREAEEGNNSISVVNTEQQTLEQILQFDETAASVICHVRVNLGLDASSLPLTKDVLGVLATLGRVNDDNLNRLFSEFLGLENMLAIVCKTYKGVKALEKYEKGRIDKNTGLHGLSHSLGRSLAGRFRVFCLENIRPYIGELLPEDPEKRLALLKPRLPNGECPPGFCGFAVNMICVDRTHLSCLTSSGHGLRETLFYSLFSRLQVYDTMDNMHSALPCISDGAISLDGGIIRSNGLFVLGDRNKAEVKFPSSIGMPTPPAKIIETDEQIKLMNWKKERLVEDMHREEALLNQVKELFNSKQKELKELLKNWNTNLI